MATVSTEKKDNLKVFLLCQDPQMGKNDNETFQKVKLNASLYNELLDGDSVKLGYNSSYRNEDMDNWTCPNCNNYAIQYKSKRHKKLLIKLHKKYCKNNMSVAKYYENKKYFDNKKLKP